MNARERFLAILVGFSMVLLVIFAGGSQIMQMFASRNAQLNALNNRIKTHQKTIQRGKVAAREIGELKSRSLPSNPDDANVLYREWLIALRDEIGVQSPLIKPLNSIPSRDQAYQTVKFRFDCEATLDQLIQLLHRFYSADDLHRINKLKLQPVPNSNQIDVDINIEAIALRDVKERKKVGDLASNRLGERTVEDYTSSIVNRNVFAPANQPPALDEIRDVSGTVGRSVSVRVSAKDPDKDKLRYEFEGEYPNDMEIDPVSGRIRWTPSKAETVHVKVRVFDDAILSKSDSAEFSIVVKDPPPPPEKDDPPPRKPSFDDSKYAFGIGVHESYGIRRFWINVRTQENQVLKVQEGDDVEVGTFKGKVSRIDLDSCVFETEEGFYRVLVGKSLQEGYIIDENLQAAKR